MEGVVGTDTAPFECQERQLKWVASDGCDLRERQFQVDQSKLACASAGVLKVCDSGHDRIRNLVQEPPAALEAR